MPKVSEEYIQNKKATHSGELLSGADRDRTDYLLNAIQSLYQLSYSPIFSTQFIQF